MFDGFTGSKDEDALARDRIILSLAEKSPQNIPSLYKNIYAEDEFQVMHWVAELERDKIVILYGFDRMYREDGGAIYLAKYGLYDATKILKYDSGSHRIMVKGYSAIIQSEVCGTCKNWLDMCDFDHSGYCQLGKKVTKWGDNCTVEIQ
jgi:hypothetical protein